MKSVKREELQGATINGLKNLLDDVNRKIVETKEFLNVLNENKKVYESELIEKLHFALFGGRKCVLERSLCGA